MNAPKTLIFCPKYYFLFFAILGIVVSACNKDHMKNNSTTHNESPIEDDDSDSDDNFDAGADSDLDSVEIVNGRKVNNTSELGKFTVALVSEKQSKQALCTGTLLAEDIVLTAAHCVENNPEKLFVVFGAEIKGVSKENIRYAEAYSQNPLWHNPTKKGHGDLALIRFRGKLPIGYKPVLLASKNTNLSIASTVTLIGYGVANGNTHGGAGILRQAQTTIIGKYTTTEIITNGKKSSVCFGDSGGPAFIMDGNHYVQWGVASSVTNKACNEAAIHTLIVGYKSWIKKTIAKLRSHRDSL